MRGTRALARLLLELVDGDAKLALADAEVGELAEQALVLARRLGALTAHGGELGAHLGEARHHVLALLLEQAHVGLHATEGVLQASALLAEVAHKQPLLLEEALELLELGALLVVAVLGELDGGVGLVRAGGEARVLLLQAAQVVHRELHSELLETSLQVVGALGLVDLALEGLQLAGDLARDHLGAGKVLVHARELAHGALLAPTVLGDVGGLLYEAAALLGAAGEHGVELALADDGVGVLAEARVVQDVLHVARGATGRC